MPRRPDLPCAGCGKLMYRGKGVLPEGQATCRACRAGTSVAHGTRKMYRERKCRCDECRGWQNAEMRAYAARVRERDGRTPWQKYRPRVTEVQDCLACGEPVATGRARADRPMHNACRPEKFWANAIQISDRDRLAIYERDGWTCQLCGDIVDRTLDPVRDAMAATLDHVTPRSHTLFPDDSPENLRLAHRACNSARGNRVAA